MQNSTIVLLNFFSKLRREVQGHQLNGAKDLFEGNLVRSKRKIKTFPQDLEGMEIKDERREVFHGRRMRIGRIGWRNRRG